MDISREEAQQRFDALQPRLREVTLLLLKGVESYEITQLLSNAYKNEPIRESTVRGYKSDIFEQLGINDLSIGKGAMFANKVFFDNYEFLVLGESAKDQESPEKEIEEFPEEEEVEPQAEQESESEKETDQPIRVPDWPTPELEGSAQLNIRQRLQNLREWTAGRRLAIGVVSGLLVLLVAVVIWRFLGWGEPAFYLSQIYPRSIEAAGGNFCIGMDPVGDPPICFAHLERDGVSYSRSIFAHANSSVEYQLDGEFDLLRMSLLLMGQACGDGAIFAVFADGQSIYQSGIITHEDDPVEIEVPISGVQVLRLETYVGPNNNLECDGTVWGEPQLITFDQ